jgi:hypothetical protein
MVIAPSASATTIETINFDSLSSTASSQDVIDYLADFGLTVSGMTQGTSLQIFDDRTVYGGGYITASSPHMCLAQGGSANAISYTLTSEVPLESFSFTRVTELAGPSGGTSYPDWNAQVFAGTTLIGSVGEGWHSLWGSDANPAHTYSFTGNGITSVTFSGDGHGSAAFNSVIIDDLHGEPLAVPEPAALSLSAVGAVALLFSRRRKISQG